MRRSSSRSAPAGLVDVMDAPQTIGMGEAAATALKKKPDSSIHRGIGLVKAGRADGFASAGNTGAVMAAALFGLGRLPGVLRPALPGYLPTPHGTVILLDVGANVEVRPEHLIQFARMGSLFGGIFLGKETPRVGLVNVGEEPGKGTDTVKETHALLRRGRREGLHRVRRQRRGPRHPARPRRRVRQRRLRGQHRAQARRERRDDPARDGPRTEITSGSTSSPSRPASSAAC